MPSSAELVGNKKVPCTSYFAHIRGVAFQRLGRSYQMGRAIPQRHCHGFLRWLPRLAVLLMVSFPLCPESLWIHYMRRNELWDEVRISSLGNPPFAARKTSKCLIVILC